MALQFTLLHNCCRRRVPNTSVHPCIYCPISNFSVRLICAAKELCSKVLDGSALHPAAQLLHKKGTKFICAYMCTISKSKVC